MIHFSPKQKYTITVGFSLKSFAEPVLLRVDLLLRDSCAADGAQVRAAGRSHEPTRANGMDDTSGLHTSLALFCSALFALASTHDSFQHVCEMNEPAEHMFIYIGGDAPVS